MYVNGTRILSYLPLKLLRAKSLREELHSLGFLSSETPNLEAALCALTLSPLSSPHPPRSVLWLLEKEEMFAT